LTETLIETKNLTVNYGLLSALEGVNFKVKKREIVGIIGSNGAGKTTLLETIAGQLKPKKGEIKFLDEEINKLSILNRRKLGIFLVPQNENIFPRMTVLKNLEVSSLYNSKSETEELIDYVFELFPILKERKKQIAHTLSGGQQKMLAIGIGLVTNTRVLLIDEPSIGLAPQLVTKVLETLKKINKDMNKTIVLSEQNIKVLKVIDRIYGLEAGKIRFSEDIKNLSENEVKELYLGKID